MILKVNIKMIEAPLPQRHSALERIFVHAPPPLWLTEQPRPGHINLRGDIGDPAFCHAVEDTLGVAPPAAANTLASTGDGVTDGVILCWLGPDEWLAMMPEQAGPAKLQALQGALANLHASVVDVSDGQTLLQLNHPQAADLLARDCPLDFHDSVFKVGSCAQSVIAKSNILILREASDAFSLVVRRSFAEYVYRLLESAALRAGI